MKNRQPPVAQRTKTLGVVFNTTRKDPDILVVPIVTVFVPIVTKYT